MDIQTEIAKQISEKLNLSPTGEQKRQLTKLSTENAAAYQLYIKGRHYSNKWTTEGFNKGIDFMRQAVDLDPAYALAHAGLAVSYYNASSQIFPASEAMPRARASALKALQLDETLAEAHTVLALVKAQFEWNWSEAEKEFKRALALNEGYASAHQYYGFYLAEQGRMDEAIIEMTRAHDLDPLSSLISGNLAWFYYLARRYDEATAQTQKLLAMDPNSGPRVLGLVYGQKGMFAQAIAEVEKQRLIDPENDAYDLALIGHAYALWGKKDQAQRLLDELRKRAKQRDVDPTCFAIIYAGLGDKDQAFAWLEKGYEGRWENMVLLKVEPLYDNLRSDPRYTELLRRMNLAP